MDIKNYMILFNPRDVFQAFLDGKKLKNRYYGDGIATWLYLDDSGHICEEDEALARTDRMNHFSYYGQDPEWETID